MNEHTPPQDLAAEQAVLGAIMYDPRTLDEVAGIITSQDFHAPKHQTIHAAILGLIDRSEPVDEVTVKDALLNAKELERIGGAPYLHTCIERMPHAASAGYYARIVAEHAARRRLIQAADRAKQLAYSGLDIDEAQDQARALFDAVPVSKADARNAEADEMAQDGIDRWEHPDDPAMPTGFADLDDRLDVGGLQRGHLTIIGARPSMGKSMVATNIAANMADAGYRVLFHSLEMRKSAIWDRITANHAGVLLKRLHRKTLTEEDWARVSHSHARTSRWPLTVNDWSGVGIAGIRKNARDMTRKPGGLSVLIVDYLQLVTPHDPRAPRQEQVGFMSRALKVLADELNIAVIALSQLNRGPEARADRRPTMSDLRESGGIEQDADEILLLHDDPDEPGVLTMLVEKNRDGSTGPVNLAWQPHFARISSLPRSH